MEYSGATLRQVENNGTEKLNGGGYMKLFEGKGRVERSAIPKVRSVASPIVILVIRKQPGLLMLQRRLTSYLTLL